MASLVHAVNNSVGLPLLTAEDMATARSELHEAAGAMGMELYLGTDASGEGDWPIEVAQHALYKKLTEGNITLDQRAAETVGGATRFPSLTIGSEDGIHGGCMMAWTRSGTRVPPIS